jgi:hypothetical protein
MTCTRRASFAVALVVAELAVHDAAADEPPPVLRAASAIEWGDPAGLVTIWVVDASGPVPSAPLVVTLVREGGDRKVRLRTGRSGYARLRVPDPGALRGLIVDCPLGGVQWVHLEPNAGHTVVVRALARDPRAMPPAPRPHREGRRHESTFGSSFDLSFGFGASDLRGSDRGSGDFVGGASILFRWRWVEGGASSELITNRRGQTQQFLGGLLGARLAPADLLLEIGAHRIEVDGSETVGDGCLGCGPATTTTYSGPAALLPSLGARLGLSWRAGQALLLGLWISYRHDVGVRRVLVRTTTDGKVATGEYLWGFTDYEPYTTQSDSTWEVGGSSLLFGFRIGVMPP